MNTDDALKAALVNLVSQITDWSNKAIQFGNDVVPELIRQYLTVSYIKCWLSLLIWAISVLLIFGVAWATRRSVNAKGKEIDGDARITVVVIGWVACGLASFFFLIAAYCNISALVTIKVAPYVFTLQHASNMVGLQ